MQFEIGTPVFTMDGKKVGTLDRIVVEPGTNEVTHLVIEKGLLFMSDKVVPMDMVGASTTDKINLRADANTLDQLPDFLDIEYVPAAQTDPEITTREKIRSLYLYPRAGTFGPFATHSATHYARQTESIPDGTVPLKENAKVITEEGEHVGNVERVLTDPQEDRATHILIAEGLFLKEGKLVPARWIKTVFTDEIHLSVDSELVDSLPEYQTQDLWARSDRTDSTGNGSYLRRAEGNVPGTIEDRSKTHPLWLSTMRGSCTRRQASHGRS
jgi:uncharacterized protein YrrD